jgi:hypothetical protein
MGIKVHLLEDGMVLRPNVPRLHDLANAIVFVKDGVIFGDLDRDPNGDLAEMGANGTVHTLETIDGVRNLGRMAYKLVGLVQDPEDLLIRKGI